MFICMWLLGLFCILTGCGGSRTGPLPAETFQATPLDLTGTVATIAGTAADFNLPVGITSDGSSLYIADCNNNQIRKIDIATGIVSTVAGTGELGSTDDGPGTLARFNNPRGITTDGTWLYVTEMVGNIRKVRISTGMVSTMATSTKLSSPTGITIAGSNLYVTDSVDHIIQKIVISSGAVTTLAGSTAGWADGNGTAAKFNQPVGITTDGSQLFVNDFGNSTIRQIDIASRVVTTLAGSPGLTGRDNGSGATARFTNPAMGIATDGTHLYVADSGNHTIRTIDISSGAVTTLAGSTAGFSDGSGAKAQFRYPEGITSDGKSLFISDSSNNAIRKLN